MKSFFNALVYLLFAVAFAAAIWYGTSAEAWHAGEHTAGCDGTDNCGCYERLTGKAVDK